MKKITRILILSVMLLAFVSPQLAAPQASQAAPMRDLNLSPSSTEIVVQPAANAEAGDWVIECVDCPKQFEFMGDHFMQLDSEGHPHVAYGGDHLYYAWYDGAEWHPETVDESNNVGSFASLSIDDDGFPHISYLGRGTSGAYEYYLKYAYKDGTGWHIQTVISEAVIGMSTSLALNKEGNPHIVYVHEYDYGLGDLKHAYMENSSWNIQTVESSEVISSYTFQSLVLDETGYPHISYTTYYDYNQGFQQLKYTFQDNAGWHTQTVDNEGNIQGMNSIVLDIYGNPHISYSEDHNGNLKYAYLDTDDWDIEVVDDECDGYHNSISTNSYGEPHIGYSCGFSLLYATQGKTGWNIQTLFSEGSVWDISIALDREGHPHFSFHHDNYPSASQMMYAYEDNSNWYFQTIDKVGAISHFSSVLDKHDYPQISYYDGENSTLTYANRDASGWNTQTIDRLEGYPSHSIDLDSEGFPHISYYYDQYGETSELIYSYSDGAVWHKTVVDHQGAGFSSLSLDSQGRPHISYCVGGQLKYAVQDSGRWQIQILDSEESVCHSTHLTLDRNDFPHISYGGEVFPSLYPDPHDLKYAYQDMNGWHFQVIEGGSVISFSSMEFDTAGNLHISYCSYYPAFGGSYSLIHAIGPSSWTSNLVYGQSNTKFSPPSLALDASDFPHISFYKDDLLNYAYLLPDRSKWEIQTVSSANGYYSSLAIDGDDDPHIIYTSYSSEYYDDLMYSYLPPQYKVTLSPTTYWNIHVPGSTTTAGLNLTNRGTETDSYTISTSGFYWPTEAPSQVGPLVGGETTTIDIQVQIPVTATIGMRDTVTITVTSVTDNNEVSVAEIITLVGNATYLPLVAK